MTTTRPMEPTRRRTRRPRMSGDDRERAILAAAERLLADQPLDRISIDDLARGAGLSRPAFYFYFPSKSAVLATLITRYLDDIDTAMDRLDPSADPGQLLQAALDLHVSTFAAHRAITTAALAERSRDAEIDRLLSALTRRRTDLAAAAIAQVQARGEAPASPGPRELAVALQLMSEQVISSSFAQVEPCIPTHRLTEVLLEIWLRAVFGADRTGDHS